MLCPEVEEVIGHQEVGDWEMLLRLLVSSIDQSHLTSALPQSVILLLLAPEVPLPNSLVKDRGDWVKGSSSISIILGHVGWSDPDCRGWIPLKASVMLASLGWLHGKPWPVPSKQ